MIAIDIEGYDPNLHELGDGSIRKDGHVFMVGTYDGNEYAWYDPTSEKLHDILLSDEPKIFHNGIYDCSWLYCGYGHWINGVIHDTMTRMAFIDEYAELGLDACCKRFNVPGKNKNDTIEAWWEENKKYLGYKGNLWSYADELWKDTTFRDLMIKYNKQDCIATYNLFFAQEPYMVPYAEPYKMECDLYPLLLKIKKVGVRIDVPALNRLLDEIKSDMYELEQRLSIMYSITPQVIRSPKQMTAVMNELGIYSPVRTPSGGQSWNADALERIDHPAVNDILAYKAKDALITKYLEGGMAKSIINGRIHCTFSPNKREDGGTITGRFACSKPNLQNISARDQKHGQKTYGTEMRKLFIPEEGQWMGAFDYSQIEYLLMANYAWGPQGDWVRQQACAGVDFHNMVKDATGIPSRDIVKRLNYGIIYGMGINKMIDINRPLFAKLAKEAGMDLETYAYGVYNDYKTKMPVVNDTMRHFEDVARTIGYVTSIGGRRHHKPKPVFVNGKWNDGIYKMTNYMLQGSAAEILKRALVKCYNDGVFDVLTFHITVHDENVVSIPKTREGVEAAVYMEQCMNDSYKDVLRVPLKAVGGVGDDWGAKHSEEDWQNIREQYGFRRSA